MVNTLVWPWKNDEELLEVRALLYPDNQHSDDVRRDRQQLGVNIVNTWKLRRCRIPHSIQATADLVDAILHNDARKNSASTIKAVYASALAKMVTSVCDLEQDSVEKRSMMEQAKKIRMPEDWVHLRHSITHGQTPGLRALEEAVRDAVPWMWDHFWKHLDVEDGMSDEELRVELIDMLTDYRRQRRAAITAKQDASMDTNLASHTSKLIRRACKKNARGRDTLINVLLYDSVLLPSEKQTTLKFRALLLMWNDLLLKISLRLPKFHSKFALALVQMLASWAISSQELAIQLQIASSWLCHILLDSAWTSTSSPSAIEDLRCDVVEACLLDKNDLTTSVMENVLEAMSGDQAEVFKQMIRYCDEESHLGDMDIDDESILSGKEAQTTSTGWSKPVTVWVPKPIGV